MNSTSPSRTLRRRRTDDVDPARDRALAAARRLFFEEGFAGATTTTVARVAGISKSTLYNRFGGMPGLLRAVAEAEADEAPLHAPTPPETTETFITALIEMGATLIALVEQPEKVQFDRLVLEQARTHPDLAEVYWEAIYARAQDTLAAFIGRGKALGTALPDLPDTVLADQLLSMWLGLANARLRLGLSPVNPCKPAERSANAVRTMVYAVKPM